MSLDYTIIGERLKKARLEKKLTQEKLAEVLNVSVPLVSRIENGRFQISLSLLNRFCNVLDTVEGNILNGSSHFSKDYLNDEFKSLLKSCPLEKQKLIYKVVKAIVEDE